MKKPKALCICFLLMISLITPPLFAQTKTGSNLVIGKVVDSSNEGIPGVNIIIKGTFTGAITDVGGNYSIYVKSEKATLQFSFLGYVSQEVIVGNKKTINVVLKEDMQTLDDVVIVGYGTKTKATLTGALSVIGNEKLLQSPSSNVTQALAGALPGVATVQSGGQPGRDAARIYIRGNGTLSNGGASPLVLVDGVERDFTDLDPNEIENVSILKDASSTAVFGVRGANGVILVTTRRGTIGKPKITVSTSFGLQQPISLRPQAGSYDYARMWNMRADNDGSTKKFTREQIEAFRTHSDPIMAPDINWQKYMFNKYFLQNKNNVNISGGSDKLKYFVSVGYMYQNGLMKKFDELPYDNNYRYDRYNYRANIDASLSKTTKVKLNIGGNIGKIREPIPVENVGYIWNVATVWSVPFAGPGIINGKRTLLSSSLSPSGDLVRDGLFSFYGYGYKQSYKTKLNIDIDLIQKLDFVTKGLTVGIKASNDYTYHLQKKREINIYNPIEYQTAYYASQLSDPSLPMNDPTFDKTVIYVPSGIDKPLRYSESYSGYTRNWYAEARLNYDRTFGDHKLTGLVLYNQSRKYYPKPYRFMPRGYVGVVGRATYGYKSKYLLDVNVGYNGSENFAPGKKRFGWFPSVSGAWIASEEDFISKLNFVGYLKLRASWGRVGSDATNSRFLYMPGIWNNSGSYSFGVNNPIGSPASTLGVPGNEDVTWETADKQNYGIDVSFLNDRLSLNADYFTEKRKGILISPNSIPSISATSLPKMNLGKVENKGFEIVLGWKDQISENLDYNISFNVSHAKNKIIFMDELPNEFDYMNRTGGSTDRYGNMHQFERLYQYDDFSQDGSGKYILKSDLPQPYIDVQPGDAMFSDLSKDGIVDANDRMVTGYSNRPEYVFGINGGFQYKAFGFNMQWSGATHVAKMLESDHRVPFTNANRGLLKAFVDESWTPKNQFNSTMPRLSKNMEAWNQAASTLWLKDASYLRLKTVNLSYKLKDKKILSDIGIESMNITLSGYNLLTLTSLKLVDPEGITNNSGQYPLVKVYSLGVTVNF